MAENKVNKVHLALLFIILAVLIWSVIKPADFPTWTMESLPAVAGLIILLITYKKFRFTTLSYVIITILAATMFIGGHYTYGNVPLFNWIKDHFDLSRNHYDRFGHFLKGMAVIVIREILIRTSPLFKGFWLSVISVSMTLAISALYEIIEWLSVLISKGKKTSKSFLGMQGDMWDAQWDMALTFIGSILFLLLLSALHNRLLKNKL
ncbi:MULTISPECIES: DUF2238 domain-containing protein [Bacillaceae]|uniref:DUF2238 domain-containing protein n=1 Tax=Bacillaceae TaxID=186817 RepID=UPI000E722491|nr:DUF2238 domain-containing protein [Bacillus sp. PK3_68]RJS60477.1 hypothetical protein CJ483_10670 [Bacillus sp. PK3_68]